MPNRAADLAQYEVETRFFYRMLGVRISVAERALAVAKKQVPKPPAKGGNKFVRKKKR
jgi:hypothetical protein